MNIIKSQGYPLFHEFSISDHLKSLSIIIVLISSGIVYFPLNLFTLINFCSVSFDAFKASLMNGKLLLLLICSSNLFISKHILIDSKSPLNSLFGFSL